jgi:hypothetical protein
MKERIAAAVGPALGFVLFVVAIWLLHGELEEYHLRDVLRNLGAIPRGRVTLAVVLTVLGYLSLTGYDTLAFRWIRHPLDYPRIALASFIAMCSATTSGSSSAAAPSLPHLHDLGVRPAEIARAISERDHLLAGIPGTRRLRLVAGPIPIPGAWHRCCDQPPGRGDPLVLLAAYAQTLRQAAWARRELGLPGIGMTAAQLVSVVDWARRACCSFSPVPGFATARCSAASCSPAARSDQPCLRAWGVRHRDRAVADNWLPGDQALGG